MQNNDELSARGAGVFGVSGRLTFETAPGFLERSAALLTGSENVTLDLSGVTLTDSAGIALLLEWLQQLRTAKRELRFTGVPEQMRRIIEVSGLSGAFGLG